MKTVYRKFYLVDKRNNLDIGKGSSNNKLLPHNRCLANCGQGIPWSGVEGTGGILESGWVALVHS